MSLPRRFAGGRSSLSAARLAVNVSFVLHEASTSQAVQRAVKASRSFSGNRRPGLPIVVDGDADIAVSLWLMPSIGNTDELTSALSGSVGVMAIDRGAPPQEEVLFFRAPARLTLPDRQIAALGIAAIVQRPGGRSRLLVVRGPYRWPEDKSTVLREMESIIQAHLGQWRPSAHLWSAPAEQLLADEIS